MNQTLLQQLSQHLKSGNLGHAEFNYLVFDNGSHQLPPETCGTVGCGIGECIVLWPLSVTMSSTLHDGTLADTIGSGWFFALGDRTPQTLASETPYNSAAIWFDISLDEAYYLFSPTISPLRTTATRYSLATLIDSFILSKVLGLDPLKEVPV